MKVQRFKISCPEIKWCHVMVMSLSSYYSSGAMLT